jgi:hypothetical protein
MGWGILGVCAQLSGMLNQLAAGTSATAFTEEIAKGLQSGTLIASVLGYELTTREDLRVSGRLEPLQEVIDVRCHIAANAGRSTWRRRVPISHEPNSAACSVWPGDAGAWRAVI